MAARRKRKGRRPKRLPRNEKGLPRYWQGTRLRERRKELGKSPTVVAAAVGHNGITVVTLNKWENNKSRPDADQLVDVAAAVEANPYYLLGLTDDPTPFDDDSSSTARSRAS